MFHRFLPRKRVSIEKIDPSLLVRKIGLEIGLVSSARLVLLLETIRPPAKKKCSLVALDSVAKVWDFPIIDGFSRDYISNNK